MPSVRSRTSDFNQRRFGAHLKAVRRSQGLSQPELARLSDLSTQVISNLERATGAPSLDTLCKVARGLRVDPRELFNAGLSGGFRSESKTEKLVQLMSTFDAELSEQALVILKALHRMRRP